MARTNYSYAKRQREKAKKKKKEDKRLKKLGKRDDQTPDEDSPVDSRETDKAEE
jgi:hypothetical protein